MRESSKFVYSLAALWFAFIPPGIARLLVIAAAGLALFLAWWLTQSPDLVVGMITDLRPGGARGTLALVDLPWADAVPVPAQLPVIRFELGPLLFSPESCHLSTWYSSNQVFS